MNIIEEKLFAMRETEFAAFSARLIPNVPIEQILGVRTPALRSLVKEVQNTPEAEAFLSKLPHRYFEENQMHSFLIAPIKDFDEAIAATERFLPYVNNWATCDQLKMKAFQKSPELLLPYLRKWLKSEHPYTVRFGIEMLMNLFLDDLFSPEYLKWVAAVELDEYYVNMMIAWYFATALAKHWDETLPYFRTHQLSDWLHKKAIQKALESFRIPQDHKLLLRTLRTVPAEHL